jgi:hypothetical protein
MACGLLAEKLEVESRCWKRAWRLSPMCTTADLGICFGEEEKIFSPLIYLSGQRYGKDYGGKILPVTAYRYKNWRFGYGKTALGKLA